MTDAIPLGRLPSRTPFSARRSALRVDPYWGRAWRSGSSGDWYSHDDWAALHAAGIVGEPKPWMRMTPEEAWKRVEAPHLRDRVLAVLGALDQWRTMTVEQVEALTGITGLTTGRTSVLTAMWTAGLIEWCDLSPRWSVTEAPRHHLVLRPASVDTSLRRVVGEMRWGEWVSTTAGLGFDANRQFTRHNLLSSELALRIAEHGNTGAVVGEKLSAWALISDDVDGAHQNGADLTIVRPDGLRVLVETTAAQVQKSKLAAKMARLARYLHEHPLPETGLTALVMVAPRHHEHPSHTRKVEKKVKAAVWKAALDWPGREGSRTRDRIAVVTWQDLFPAPDTVIPDFGQLPAELPPETGTGGLWRPTWMLDAAAYPFTPTDPTSMTAVITRAATLRGAPHMLRPDSVTIPTGGRQMGTRAKGSPEIARLLW